MTPKELERTAQRCESRAAMACLRALDEWLDWRRQSPRFHNIDTTLESVRLQLWDLARQAHLPEQLDTGDELAVRLTTLREAR